MPERIRSDIGLPPVKFFVLSFGPAAALLLGAALAFLAPGGATGRRGRGRP